MNARFWVYVRGWVKVTLAPLQKLDWTVSGRHEEGWFREGMSLYHAPDGFVRMILWSDGTDCDGRHSTETELVAPLTAIQRADHSKWDADVLEWHREPEWRRYSSPPVFRPRTPEWVEEDSFQRDYFAEAAGY
jgi:hypothetical protein